LVLPFALGAGVYAAASRRPDRQLVLTSRQSGGEPVALDIDALQPGSVTGWAAYPAGVAWALRQAGYLGGGADVAVDADLPAGAGRRPVRRSPPGLRGGRVPAGRPVAARRGGRPGGAGPAGRPVPAARGRARHRRERPRPAGRPTAAGRPPPGGRRAADHVAP